jgi:hypothetical protein
MKNDHVRDLTPTQRAEHVFPDRHEAIVSQ